MDEYTSLYMYLVEGVDSNGDPIRALVSARDAAHARKKVRQEYLGAIKNLRVERITGHQWDEYLRGYGTQYGSLGPMGYPEDYAPEANRYAIREGRPIFI